MNVNFDANLPHVFIHNSRFGVKEYTYILRLKMPTWAFGITAFPYSILLGLVFIFSCVACGPKCLVKGRVVDAATYRPIEKAAVAVRWMEDSSTQNHAITETLDAAQVLSDTRGIFQIPHLLEQP
jgi:hypothetical protein